MDAYSFYAGRCKDDIIDFRLFEESHDINDIYDENYFEEIEDHLLDILNVDGVTFRQIIREATSIPCFVASARD